MLEIAATYDRLAEIAKGPQRSKRVKATRRLPPFACYALRAPPAPGRHSSVYNATSARPDATPSAEQPNFAAVLAIGAALGFSSVAKRVEP